MKELKAAAKELNEVLGIDPPIETKVGVKKKDLQEKLLEAAEMIEEGDVEDISKETFEVLDDVGAEFDFETPLDEDDPEEPEEKEEEEEEEEKEEEKPAKKTKTAKKEGPKKATGKNGKGVIGTIRAMLEKTSKKKPISKAEIVEELIEQFPDRNQKSMKNTVNVQVPGRVSKEAFEVKKTEDGKFYKA